MIKKLISAIAVTLFIFAAGFGLMFFFDSLFAVEEAAAWGDKYERFECIEDYGKQMVYVDRETGVCYLKSFSGYGVGITVMVDADGKPLLEK